MLFEKINWQPHPAHVGARLIAPVPRALRLGSHQEPWQVALLLPAGAINRAPTLTLAHCWFILSKLIIGPRSLPMNRWCAR